MTKPATRDYIGDGLYVEVEETGSIKLYASDGINELETVYLDAGVLTAFERYIKRMRELGEIA